MTNTRSAVPVPVDSIDSQTNEIVVNYDVIEAIRVYVKTSTRIAHDTLEQVIEQTIERLYQLGHLNVRTSRDD